MEESEIFTVREVSFQPEGDADWKETSYTLNTDSLDWVRFDKNKCFILIFLMLFNNHRNFILSLLFLFVSQDQVERVQY